MVHHVPREKQKTVIFWLQHKLWCVYRPYKAKLPNSQAAGRGKRKDKNFRFSRLFLKALNFQRLIQRIFLNSPENRYKLTFSFPPSARRDFQKNFVQPLHMLNFMFKPKTPRFRFFIGDMMDHFLSLAVLRVKIAKIAKLNNFELSNDNLTKLHF